MTVQICKFVLPISYTAMDIDDDAKEHTAKKMKTIVALITEVLQIPPLKDNSEKNLKNLGKSFVIPKNPTITLPDTLNKTNQKIFLGPISVPVTFFTTNH